MSIPGAGWVFALFWQALTLNPDHCVTTLRLTRAMDQGGKPEEALPVWRKMLEMAEAVGDAETIHTVRAWLTDAGR
jgi:cytochrome c-type biogenesis protein CcmH/NrfG